MYIYTYIHIVLEGLLSGVFMYVPDMCFIGTWTLQETSLSSQTSTPMPWQM